MDKVTTICKITGPDEEQLARLIRTAPRLLAVCKNALELYSPGEHTENPKGCLICKSHLELIEVIKEAEGL